MLWTDEAVEVLRRLAGQGRSASAIAEALGAASRSAVIGKANRIGIRLNGDGRALLPAAAPIPHATAEPPIRPARERKAALTSAAIEVGEMRRVKFEDIRRFACKWPLGDPRAEDFAYCGLTAVEGRSYCAGHCRMAYRPPDRRSGRERRASRTFMALTASRTS